jgi:hypothetical protein
MIPSFLFLDAMREIKPRLNPAWQIIFSSAGKGLSRLNRCLDYLLSPGNLRGLIFLSPQNKNHSDGNQIGLLHTNNHIITYFEVIRKMDELENLKKKITELQVRQAEVDRLNKEKEEGEARFPNNHEGGADRHRPGREPHPDLGDGEDDGDDRLF